MILNTQKAFTLAELLITIVILGAVAGLAIPRYTKTLEIQNRRDAELNLKTIHTANNIRFSRTGQYWPVGTTGEVITAINSNLNLSIIENAVLYECDGVADGSTYTCHGERPSYVVTITQAAISGTNPSCSGDCP